MLKLLHSKVSVTLSFQNPPLKFLIVRTFICVLFLTILVIVLVIVRGNIAKAPQLKAMSEVLTLVLLRVEQIRVLLSL